MEKEKLEQKLTFDDQVIEKIAGITANHVPGIISLDGNMFSEFTDKLTQGTDKTISVSIPCLRRISTTVSASISS